MERGEHILQEQYGTAKRAQSFYDYQMLDYLNNNMMEFIAKQTMVFIATADGKGDCDSSLRVGKAGFVRVIDNRTLLYPEYKGNGVYASLGNILENPHIGLLFIDFFDNQIGLHVNGKASVIENTHLSKLNLEEQIWNDIKEKEGNKPERWVLIYIDEAYIHCSKHIPVLREMDKTIEWGTDDEKYKGGDFFKAKLSKTNTAL